MGSFSGVVAALSAHVKGNCSFRDMPDPAIKRMRIGNDLETRV
jgi:hypothetical protein